MGRCWHHSCTGQGDESGILVGELSHAAPQVHILTDEVNRDCIAANAELLELAAEHLGLRASVKTIHVHVQCLYDLMMIPAQRVLRGPLVSLCLEAILWRYRRGRFADASLLSTTG